MGMGKRPKRFQFMAARIAQSACMMRERLESNPVQLAPATHPRLFTQMALEIRLAHRRAVIAKFDEPLKAENIVRSWRRGKVQNV
jgi:hypothetical protein